MSQVLFTSTGRALRPEAGVQAFGAWRAPQVYAQLRRDGGPRIMNPAPRSISAALMGPCTDAELLGHIRQVLDDSPFHGEGYRKVWARLRIARIRTSKERVRPLMREAGLPTGNGKMTP